MKAMDKEKVAAAVAKRLDLQERPLIMLSERVVSKRQF